VTTRPEPSGWGPDERRAAIAVSFETLGEGPAAVTPALPTLLRVLAEHDLSATFFIDEDVGRAEPLALTMASTGGHEIGGLVTSEDAVAATVAALEAPGRRVEGVRPRRDTAAPSPEGLEAAGIRYLSAPDGSLRLDGALVRIPLDRRLADAGERDPQAWHQAMQVAVAGALEGGTLLTLTFFPGRLERRDTLAVFVETVDLVVGLRRAGRVWTPTLSQLAAWWAARPG
jgi:hypothetical protein